MCARRFPKTTKAASLDSYGRFAGGPAGMAITPKPRDSASPSFDGFALSSDYLKLSGVSPPHPMVPGPCPGDTLTPLTSSPVA